MLDNTPGRFAEGHEAQEPYPFTPPQTSNITLRQRKGETLTPRSPLHRIPKNTKPSQDTSKNPGNHLNCYCIGNLCGKTLFFHGFIASVN